VANLELNRTFPGWYWKLPLLVLAVGTLAAWVFNLDVAISRLFYEPGATQPWPLEKAAFVRFVYQWGEIPAVVLGMAACLLIALAARREPERTLNRAGLILLLSLIVGPLLLTNSVLKSYYGRPRPQQVTEFGGTQPFRPVLLPTFDHKQNSFPSGHVAAAFAVMLPFFVLRRGDRRWAYGALAAGVAYGSVMGAVRIAQGAHFFSDVLWSAGVVWFSGLAASWLIESAPQRSRETRWTRARVLAVRFAAVAGCMLIAMTYLVRLPFNQTYDWIVPIDPNKPRANIELITLNGRAEIVEDPSAKQVHVQVTASGRGLPIDPVQEHRSVVKSRGEQSRVRYTFLPTWSTINFSSKIVVQAPPGVKLSIRHPKGEPPPVVVTSVRDAEPASE
jgi:membrane-associated PAP2 superfamily phosphatase